MDQEVITNNFQESPGLLTDCCVAFLADIGVVEDPHQDECVSVLLLVVESVVILVVIHN